MFLKHFSNEGFLLDSNYAKIIFEKQEQSAFAYAVKKQRALTLWKGDDKNANYADQKGRPTYAVPQRRVHPVLLLHPEKHPVPLWSGAERHSTEPAGAAP